MSIETYITRGREIVSAVVKLSRRKPLPVAKLEAISEEWRGSLPTILDLAKTEPIERRLEIQNYFMDVDDVINLPFIQAQKKKRRKK